MACFTTRRYIADGEDRYNNLSSYIPEFTTIRQYNANTHTERCNVSGTTETKKSNSGDSRKHFSNSQASIANNQIYRIILNTKANAIKAMSKSHQTTAALSQSQASVRSSSSTHSQAIIKLPLRSSKLYNELVLGPRGILIETDSHDINAIELFYQGLGSPSDHDLKKALGDTYVSFNVDMLVRAANIAAQDNFSEFEWTVHVYYTFFLRSDPLTRATGIRRCGQKSWVWYGEKQNICIPQPTSHDRRESGLYLYEKVWVPYPFDLPTDSREGNFALADNCYFAIRESQKILLGNYSAYPAFRGGIFSNERLISTPCYLIDEDKASPDKAIEARQYVAMLASGLLHERLLLRYLSDTAQANSRIPYDDTLCVYVTTTCGKLWSLFKMAIRDNCEIGKHIRYDLTELCQVNLTIHTECEVLKRWINYIHWWGFEKHNKAAMFEASEAFESRFRKRGGWEKSLDKVYFYYAEDSIGFDRLSPTFISKGLVERIDTSKSSLSKPSKIPRPTQNTRVTRSRSSKPSVKS